MPRIEGLTIEISADAKKFQSEIRGLDSSIGKARNSLMQVNKALRFNPGNADLIKQKQQLLGRQIEDTKTKLTRLKEEEDKLKSSDGFDENSEDAQRLRREIIETESKLKSLNKQADKVASVFGVQMQAAGQKMIDLGKNISRTGDMLTTRLTMPLAALGGVAVKKFAEVDKTMQLTNATMGNTEAEAKQISDAMKEAAANSTFGMNDAAQASLNFARAGLDAAQAASTLAPAMNLAAGEGGNLDTVSAGLTATINGFSDTFDNASKYADVFANACNNSALDVDSLSEAMSIAAPVFSAAGYKVEDAALYMGVMANRGIDANKAANSLKTGISRLVKPTDEAAGWLERLGVEIVNADGSMKDSVTVQKDLHNAFKNLSESEQIAAASAIFGKNQMSPWLALINTAPEDVNELADALGKEGTTAEMADAMMSGFGGSLEKLKSSIDVAATSLGEALAPTIRNVSDRIQSMVDAFNAMDESQQQTIVKTGLMVAAAGPLLSIGGRLLTGIGGLVKGMGAAITKIAALGTATNLSIAPIVAAVAAIGALGIATNNAYKNHKQAIIDQHALTEEQRASIDAINASVDAYKQSVSAAEEKTESVAAEYQHIRDLKEEYNGLVDANGKIAESDKARADVIMGELAQALGVEKSEIQKMIDKNGQLTGSIDKVIAKQEAQAYLDANYDNYVDSIKQQTKSNEDLAKALQTRGEAEKGVTDAQAALAAAQTKLSNSTTGNVAQHNKMAQAVRDAQTALDSEKQKLAEADEAVQKNAEANKSASEKISQYQQLQEAVQTGSYDKINDSLTAYQQNLKNAGSASKGELAQQALDAQKNLKAIEKAYKSGDATKAALDGAKKRADAADAEARKVGVDTNAIKNSLTNNTAAGGKSATKSFNQISASANTSMNSAKRSVSGGAATIKNSFPINVGSIMHGTIANIASTVKSIAGQKVSVPTVQGFHKFAKAYDNPLLFTTPTLYGGAIVGDRGSHAGGEMIYGRDNLMKDIQSAVGGMGTTINVTVNGADNPEIWADRFVKEYQLAQRMA